MEKFKGKYRIPSARWATWDYGSNAAYFITICTANREHSFGKIVKGEMIMSAIGQSALDCWHEIPNHFPFVVLDQFVVMPNHVHGIVVIDKPTNMVETQNFASVIGETQDVASVIGETQDVASGSVKETHDYASGSVKETHDYASGSVKETHDYASGSVKETHDYASLRGNKFGPQSKNLASIVRGYKIGVTKYARQNNIPFAWQPRYHDHVIRNADECERVRNYIHGNPRKWAEDKFYSPHQ